MTVDTHIQIKSNAHPRTISPLWLLEGYNSYLLIFANLSTFLVSHNVDFLQAFRYIEVNE